MGELIKIITGFYSRYEFLVHKLKNKTLKNLHLIFYKSIFTLTGVAQWVGCYLENWKVTDSIPSPGVKQPMDVSFLHQCFFPSLSPSLPLSLKIKLQKNFSSFIGIYLTHNWIELLWLYLVFGQGMWNMDSLCHLSIATSSFPSGVESSVHVVCCVLLM